MADSSREKTMCEVVLAKALRNDKRIRILAHSIEKTGCPVGANFFQCSPCQESNVLAFFEPETGVTVCQNNLTHQTNGAVASGIAHELVHAFDYCRANVSFNNCVHHACSEIRAANLSGECKLSYELLRGRPKFLRGWPECVRRRALLSVQMNPSCQGAAGKQAVDQAWDTCIKDLKPFDHLLE